MIIRNNYEYITDDILFSYLNAFDSFDWKNEPKETWKSLCKQRALQLKDTYDYIILYNSGGSDSTTVLNAFLDNNIPLDEVVTVSFDNINQPCVDGKKAEYDLKLKNYTGFFNKVSIKMPQIVQFMKNDNFLLNAPNFTGQMHSFARFNIEYLEKFGFAKPKIRQGKICHLYGESDPDVYEQQGKYYAVMDVRKKFNASNFHLNTLFFTDPMFPKLHIKQCHMIVNLLKNNLNSIITIKETKLTIRDCYSPLISPEKAADNPTFILERLQSYNEPTAILQKYIEIDNTFADLYVHSSLKQQKNITSKISVLNLKHKREYCLL